MLFFINKSKKIKLLILFVITIAVLLISGCDAEEEAWTEAKEVDAIESYEEFLKEYPEGEYAEEALWHKADMVNTIEGYEKYMVEYPDGDFFLEAKKGLSDVKWQKTLEEDTIESYEKYLSRFPFGYHSNVAKEELLWYQVSEEDTIDGYARYLRVYPEGKYYEIAKEKTSLARIKLDVTISRWKWDTRHFCIENDLKNMLADNNFFVALEDYDVTLFIDYKENKGELYTSGDYGTIIQCELKLLDNKGNLLYEEFISAETSTRVTETSPSRGDPIWVSILYDNAVRNFKNTDEFQNLMHDITKIFEGQS